MSDSVQQGVVVALRTSEKRSAAKVSNIHFNKSLTVLNLEAGAGLKNECSAYGAVPHGTKQVRMHSFQEVNFILFRNGIRRLSFL